MSAPLVAAAGAVLVGAGLVTIAAALRTAPSVTSPSRLGPWTEAVRRARSGVSARRAGIAAGAAAGLVVWVLTGWAVAAVILPAAAVVLPSLLRAPDSKRVIARLEAMEEWTRNLAGVLTVGVGLEQAVIASLRTAPEAIRPEVATLVARLRVRWNTEQALRAFAQDLDDPTGDRIATALVVGARSRAQGLAIVIERLSETVADEVRMRRRIETDRAKPRAAARYVTITVIATTGLVALMGDYISAYGTAQGQLLLIAWLGAYLACLLWLRRITAGRPMPRFLDATLAGARAGGGGR